MESIYHREKRPLSLSVPLSLDMSLWCATPHAPTLCCYGLISLRTPFCPPINGNPSVQTFIGLFISEGQWQPDMHSEER